MKGQRVFLGPNSKEPNRPLFFKSLHNLHYETKLQVSEIVLINSTLSFGWRLSQAISSGGESSKRPSRDFLMAFGVVSSRDDKVRF
jgi:hypothetical protein